VTGQLLAAASGPAAAADGLVSFAALVAGGLILVGAIGPGSLAS